MARYVLLQFDSNDAAQLFIEGTNVDASLALDRNEEPITTVVGLFAKPTTFCEHPPSKELGARGKVFGWYVRRCCNKAVRGRQFMRNLLFDSAGDILDSDIYVVSKEGL